MGAEVVFRKKNRNVLAFAEMTQKSSLPAQPRQVHLVPPCFIFDAFIH